MSPGDIIAGRFEIERAVASGGMGQVYQAKDRVDGGAVALKVLTRAIDEGSARFAREVEVLASLHHPGIVRYVAHGELRGGLPFLAMEWLTGETLSARLDRGPLSIADSIALAARIASALGAIHRRGLVHRDLKPSNIFLVDGAIEGAKIIDFGIVGLRGRGPALTSTAGLLGTPTYMAPEQIRSADDVSARADVFSLGCVLFRCLTGKRAFVGDDDLSILLKVLIEDPPAPSALRADVPSQLDALLVRMLSKSPEHRPRDGDAITKALEALVTTEGSASAPSGQALTEITSDERRVICLLLTAETLGKSAATLSSQRNEARARAIEAEVARHQGRLELLGDRSALAVLIGDGAATDFVARAARCALALAPRLDRAPIAVVTGRARLAADLPMGELIDRAVALLGSALSRGVAAGASIRLDEVTAGLLGGQFDVAADDAGTFLRGEREALEASFTLLGKPTACVGRERELALLGDTFARCAEEGVAGALLVTAPPGAGKSRLTQEFLRRLRDRSEPMEVWIGRGDPLSAGSPFSLLGQAIRRTAGLLDGEPIEARRRKLEARVSRHPRDDRRRVAGFLGELCGTPFPDEGGEGGDMLRAARRDPALMGEQMRHAFHDFLRAECAARPVVLVLEDLHWGDVPTIRFVDMALRDLHDQPLLILALARSEIDEVFPKLWEGRGLERLRLAPLSRRPSERMVREALGSSVTPELVSSIVARADGNAFYLEELIRAAAHGEGAALPETVLAMVEARFEGLAPESRRVLRAASVFGQVFWRGGVVALLGGARAVDDWLAALVHQEMISLDASGKFPGEVEYTFRHALLREAAYRMLTEEDRRLGHRLAGEWLERAGEVDASVLAEHFERGGETAHAAIWYRRAAERAASGRRSGGSGRRSSGDWSGKDSSPRTSSKRGGGNETR